MHVAVSCLFIDCSIGRGLLRRQSFSSSDMESDAEQLSQMRQNDQIMANIEASGECVRTTTPADDSSPSSVNGAGNELKTTSSPIMDVSADLQSPDELNDLYRAIAKCESRNTVYVERTVLGSDVIESMDDYHSSIHRAPVKEAHVAGLFGASVNREKVGVLVVDVSPNVATNTRREIPICEQSDELVADGRGARVSGKETKSAASVFLNASFRGSISKQLSSQIAALLSEIDSAKDLNIQV